MMAHYDTVLHYFLNYAERFPEREAVTDATTRLTYSELDRRSSAVAAFLRAQGIGKGDLVPLLCDRTHRYVVAILGVMKSGAAYIPVDVRYPSERQRRILTQSGASFALAACADTPADAPFRVHSIDDMTDSDDTPATLPSSQDLAYVIFTSGTTGNPKGVMVEHHAFERVVSSHNDNLEVAQGSRSTLMAGTGFDVAQLEIASMLMAGGTLILPDEETRLDPDRLLAFFARQGLTHAFVPTALVPGITALAQPPELALTHLFTAGEKLIPPATEHLPYELVDCYGPAEATIFATRHRVPGIEVDERPSIGYPMAGSEIFLLDERLAQVPDGETGEIFIGGDNLARGYLHNEPLTREKFIIHPQWRQRLYRTGDLARWLPDGRLQFLGRLDDQVKIRGNRVELAEVEEALHAQAGVSEAVVLVSAAETDGEELNLLAFIVPDQQQPSTETEMRREMLKTLPDYMAPSAILRLDSLPLNANGKTDKQALLQMYRRLTGSTDNGVREHASEAVYISQMERDIADAWASVLGHRRFDRTDRFFDVGGHSLLAARLMQDVRERLSIQVWIRDLFEHDTVASLASLLEERRRDDQPRPLLDRERIHPLREDASLPDDLVFQPWQATDSLARPRHILLTGVTGFVGAHLLVDLLATTDACLHCPIRARSGSDPWRRLDDTLARYGMTLSDADRERIEVYRADLSDPRLGLTKMHYDELAEAVDVIYHSASAVNFIQPYSYMKRDNVQGLMELLRFAAAKRTKPLMLLSTISVYSWGHLHTRKRVMREDDDIDQNLDAVITDIGYVRSKWVMEKIADQAAQRGLPLMTFRLGYATYHSTRGVCADYQWWGRLVQTCVEHQSIPDLEALREGLTSVDYMTAAIAHISRNPEGLDHKFNLIHEGDNNLTFKEFFSRLEEQFGFRFKVLPYAQWKAQWEHDPRAPLYPLLSLFTDTMYDGKSTVELYQNTYLWDCRNTKNFLRGSGIEEPVFSHEELTSYLSYLDVPIPQGTSHIV
ncbi:amino acid adenylation domain-containing protein [Halomonas elongata]|uniref:amino acid adenylation domain-containing protein n=1 Tax=Halomonas elongata TaxID=2746 RepID=UPI0023B071EB|nr:amino acid adenylation domain-containing protein [Halomonas elongata]